MFALCDKVISREEAEEFRRMVRMTKFERIIYEEQQEAIRKSLREDEKRIARNFLIKGISPVDIAESTGFSGVP